ncbi:MAG: hypothetical protein EA408_13165 [Marinilabiliales bacterium]|nr:MAG: hypothetical protein EA408_13165 [Marinilabiliales bacterium]
MNSKLFLIVVSAILRDPDTGKNFDFYETEWFIQGNAVVYLFSFSSSDNRFYKDKKQEIRLLLEDLQIIN